MPDPIMQAQICKSSAWKLRQINTGKPQGIKSQMGLLRPPQVLVHRCLFQKGIVKHHTVSQNHIILQEIKELWNHRFTPLRFQQLFLRNSGKPGNLFRKCDARANQLLKAVDDLTIPYLHGTHFDDLIIFWI